MKALLGIPSNIEYALSWTAEELGIISDEVEPPHSTRLESCQKLLKDGVFQIPKKLIRMEKRGLKTEFCMTDLSPLGAITGILII